jgi:hypothetical protein
MAQIIFEFFLPTSCSFSTIRFSIFALVYKIWNAFSEVFQRILTSNLIKNQKTHSEVFFQRKKIEKHVPKDLFKKKNRNSGNRKET